MFRHEVELSERKTENTSYKEILTFLDDGKAYQSNPDQRLP